jgi:hypothetical protein
MEGFKKLVPKKCKVLRDGTIVILDAVELVPGQQNSAGHVLRPAALDHAWPPLLLFLAQARLCTMPLWTPLLLPSPLLPSSPQATLWT